MEYKGKIKDRCIAKPETEEVRTARRKAEFDGLEQAQQNLEVNGKQVNDMNFGAPGTRPTKR